MFSGTLCASLTALLSVQLFAPGVTTVASLAQDPGFRERDVLDPNRDQWVPQVAITAAPPLVEARRLLAEDEPDDARDLLEGWLEANPDSEQYYAGVLLLGETYFAEQDYWKAAEQFERVADSTAGELFFEALRRIMDTARAFLAGEPRIVWGVLRLPAGPDGIELLDRVWERAPATRIAEEALKIKADYFFAQGQMDFAQDEYQRLYREFPEGRYARVALLRSAEASEALFAGVRYDARPLIEADERYRTVQDVFPAYAESEAVAARRTGIRQQQAAKDLSIAQWYERAGYPEAAGYYYRVVLNDYSDTPAAEAARSGLSGLGIGVARGPAGEAGRDPGASEPVSETPASEVTP
jgi:tetratricopeptide (TPR) repeat protein